MADEQFLDAAKKGDVLSMISALNSGANLEARDADTRTALHLAAVRNNLHVAQLLLDQGANVNAFMDDRGTPLFDAAACGHNEMVSLLVSRGARFDLTDNSGMSVLDWAIDQHHFDTAKLLVSYFPISLKIISARIDNILNEVALDENYYSIRTEVSEKELAKQKWKTYIYLRKCVLDYRTGNPGELLQVLNFLESDLSNKTWLAEKLLDRPHRATDEQWGSGNHEWLERSLIVKVLERSAGMVAGVQAETESTDHANIDWLYVQAQLRSPTKYLFFKLSGNIIREGHCGAVKPRLDRSGFSSKGNHAFHMSLEKAFNESTTLAGFIIRIHNIFKLDVISGKKPLLADHETRFVVDGTETSDREGVDGFRINRLRFFGYNITNRLMKELTARAAENGPLDNYSASPVESESSEEGDIDTTTRFII